MEQRSVETPQTIEYEVKGLDTWRKERALENPDRGEVTFMQAAEMADLSVWDFARLARERDMAWVEGDQLAEDLESL